MEAAEETNPHCCWPGIVSLSYCWQSKEHPDPRCEQLLLLPGYIRWIMANRGKYGKEPDFVLFIDFFSLYQGARTPQEEQLFKEGLYGMDVLYGHRGILTLIQSNFVDDGGRGGSQRQHASGASPHRP
mmetsp:Transcript_14331/g.28567  ORF Transcript_14331/g.28567 Transcript_14331/m.28567 type:complete len:128 (+) Transcript_14331:156-539(+)